MNGVKQIGEGSKRYNTNKIRVSYIPASLQEALLRFCRDNGYTLPVSSIMALGEHFSLGSVKYPDETTEDGFPFPNWAKGQYFESMLSNCILRHIYAFESGEEYDIDFGSHHLIAASWGFACLYHQFANYPLYASFDDRLWVSFHKKAEWEMKDEPLYYILSILQESDPIVCEELALKGCFRCLEKTWLPLRFVIDEKRLNKIKETDYGTPTIASAGKKG